MTVFHIRVKVLLNRSSRSETKGNQSQKVINDHSHPYPGNIESFEEGFGLPEVWNKDLSGTYLDLKG